MSTTPTVMPYGTWESPITPAQLTHAGMGLSEVVADGAAVYWVESRPLEAGRSVIVRRRPDGSTNDVSPEGFDSRTRVHEYGGGAYGVHQGVVVSSRFEDQRVYRLDGPEPVPITPAPARPAGDRYADFELTGEWVIAVRERHRTDGEPVNHLVRFPADGSAEPEVIAAGHDFYAAPRVSPDGRRLAWLSWNHPRMPWDGTELWVAELAADATLGEPDLVAGGPEESVFQPEWSPEGHLHFVSDRSGWWNLYRRHDDGTVVRLVEQKAEWGVPQWMFGLATYRFLPDERIVAIVAAEGRSTLQLVDGEQVHRIDVDRDVIDPTLAVAAGRVWTVAASATAAAGVVAVDPDSGRVEEVRSSISLDLDPAFVSRGEAIVFPTSGGAVAHAFYYPPTNPGFVAPAGELAPLVVWTHGGPTSATTPALLLARQFWTSRGFALVDVNYRGSAGYGRAYRQALVEQWGVVDTDDCIAAARHLVSRGRADPDRLAIRGGSAGGYTTLCALTFHDVFAAGASYFGVGDLEALATDTHKFESRYLDSMVGPYPQEAKRYRDRSPIHHVRRLRRPMLILQGLDDEVVPPAQAEVMVAALSAGGVPHAYLAFDGEGHGFRQADHIEQAVEAELWFYGWVFGFVPAGHLRHPPLRGAEGG